MIAQCPRRCRQVTTFDSRVLRSSKCFVATNLLSRPSIPANFGVNWSLSQTWVTRLVQCGSESTSALQRRLRRFESQRSTTLVAMQFVNMTIWKAHEKMILVYSLPYVHTHNLHLIEGNASIRNTCIGECHG